MTGKKRPIFQLTNRQKQVMALLEAGCTTHQIAERLGITDRAVTHHISKVRRRLGVNSRAQLVALLVLKRTQIKRGETV
ncbi:MAG TPA: helix-turn-helix transcriptional regulator [Levilinea sp.]|nr:helix-turn-helix transcriptional regulator [Levilinea sp.]